MSDFYGCLSSTSFRVKNRKGFLADPEVKFIKDYAESKDGFFESDECNYFTFGWKGQDPSLIEPNSTYVWEEHGPDFSPPSYVDLGDGPGYVARVIRRHILPGDVCQIGVSGNENLSYIGGSITWVTSKGITYLDGTTQHNDKIDGNGLKDLVAKLSTEVASIV